MPNLIYGAATFFSDLDASLFSGLMDEIKAALPVILPVCISFLAFRKGWSFIKAQIKGA